MDRATRVLVLVASVVVIVVSLVFLLTRPAHSAPHQVQWSPGCYEVGEWPLMPSPPPCYQVKP